MLENPKERLLRIGRALSTPKVKKIGGWLAALWLAFSVLGYFVAPPLAKSLLIGQLAQALGRDVSIEKITVNPWALSAQVQGLSVKDRQGGEQFGFAQLDVNLSSFSMAQVGIVADAIRLQAPRVAVTRLANGRFDISDLLDKWQAPSDKGSSGVPRFSLNNIEVVDGKLDVDDQSKGVRHTVEAIHFSLPFISSLPYKADVFVQPAFSAVVDGAQLRFQGQSKPFAASHASELELHLQDVALSRLQPYLPATLPLRLSSGQLATALKLAFAQQPDGVQTLRLSGTAQVQGLALAEVSGAPWLSLDKLDVALQEADPLLGHWTFEQLALQGLRVGQGQPSLPLRIGQLAVQQARLDLQARRVEAAEVKAAAVQARVGRTPHGEIAFLALPRTGQSAAPAAQTPGPSTAPPPASDWVARVGRFSLDGSSLRFEDRTLTPTAVQNIEQVRLTAENIDSTPTHTNTFTLAARVNPSGTLQAEGTLQLQPLVARLKLDTRALPVSPLQGYIDPYLQATQLQGQFSSQGTLDIQQHPGALQASYKGDLTLAQFSATDTANRTDLLKWKSLYVGDVDFQLDPARLKVGEIALSDFYSRLALSKEGRLNLTDMVRVPASHAPAQDVAPKPPLPIQIAKITLQNGQVNFTDNFIRPNYRANISRLGGSIRNLSSAPDTLADLDLRGSYAHNAPVHISAKLNPLADKKFLDLQAEVSSINLVDLSPYSGKYAGYNIDKGQLSLTATYKLENRQLTAENRIFIDQLTFGEKVESPDATQLPVHLAIALLKNNRGEIDINLPISGSLDDPQFSIGGLIFKVIANLFVKAVTSPFALLGSLFGDSQELSQIGFAPGRASLDDAAIKKLETLAKAMREREGLKLEITGGADPDLDQEGLKRLGLERAMRAEKRKDLAARQRESVSAQDVQIGADEYATYLTRAYKQAAFPKPRNLIGLPKELPVPEMEKLMLAQHSVSDEDVRQLAARRAQAAQSWLVEQGQLPLNRVFLLPVQVGTGASSPTQKPRNRVDFSLR